MTNRNRRKGTLVLADGSVFEGYLAGYESNEMSSGEAVFNTSMSGYQEIVSDPSYAGQIVTFTYPHFGNYGVNDYDLESKGTFCNGLIVRDITTRPSNWRSEEGVESWLSRMQISVLCGIDTRRLTIILRNSGAMGCAFGPSNIFSVNDLLECAQNGQNTDGKDLVKDVTCHSPYKRGDGPLNVVAFDFGIKTNILRYLSEFATVSVVGAQTTGEQILSGEVSGSRPDGVFLSNGPGDPSALDYCVQSIKDLLGDVPIFGICLGHQLLGRALGATTEKLRFGHHGANHPIKNLRTKKIEITSQNHSYALSREGLGNIEITHENLNDGVIEGIRVKDERAFSVQYHPEGGPGPHDASYLFKEFQELMLTGKRKVTL